MKTEQNHLEVTTEDLTKDELDNYQTLRKHDTDWAARYIQMLLDGRDKITARLMASLYRENLVGGYTNCEFVQADKLNNPALTTGEVLMIHFKQSQQSLYARVIGHHAFNRIDVAGPFYWQLQSGDDRRVLHPNEVLNVIINEDAQFQGAAAEQFLDDLENSAAHMTLALSYQAQHPLNQAASLLEYIETQTDQYLTSEQLVIEGHPIHPGAKLRKGMTAQENIAYSSEYQHAIPMQFILVHQDVARTMAQTGTYQAVIYEAFDGLQSAAEHALSSVGTFKDYVPFIVHPWQYQHVILHDYRGAFDQQQMIPLDYSVDYYAGLSFRTLMPKKPVHSPHIKLSTNVHITGEIRTLSEQTTHNGPLMTRILKDINAHDKIFHNVATSPVPETAGAHYYNPQGVTPEEQERLSEQLGTLLRQNIYDMVDATSLPLIPSSLVVTHPKTGRPLIVDLVERYADTMHLSQHDACVEWFKSYAQALIGYVVPLLVKYGIALEAHLQNTIAVFNPSTGEFLHMLIRDFEGLRIDRDQLAKMGYATEDFHEKSRILTTSQTSVFNKAFYSTIQNHLGELVAMLARFYQQPSIESALWQVVRQQIDHSFQQLQSSSNIDVDRLNTMRDIFYDSTIDYKCVTTMRLMDEAHEYTYIKVDNPLSF